MNRTSPKTRKVNKQLFRNYVEKAGESLSTAKDCLAEGRWNSAVINAVHCGINACDALTVFMIGLRHAGERHEDAIGLLQSLRMPKAALNSKIKQLSMLLSIKNAAEYEERMMTEEEANAAVRDAERFYEWVKSFLPMT